MKTVLLLAVASVSAVGIVAAVGCSSDDTTTSPAADSGAAATDSGGTSGDSGSVKDAGAGGDGSCGATYNPADYLDSGCGHPGDLGNAQGVGKFCTTSADCSCTSGANICATLGGAGHNFCTTLCTPTDGGDSGCGDNATCACQGAGQCGCTPNVCL